MAVEDSTCRAEKTGAVHIRSKKDGSTLGFLHVCFFSCYKKALKSPEKFSFSLCISSEWLSVCDDEGDHLPNYCCYFWCFCCFFFVLFFYFLFFFVLWVLSFEILLVVDLGITVHGIVHLIYSDVTFY